MDIVTRGGVAKFSLCTRWLSLKLRIFHRRVDGTAIAACRRWAKRGDSEFHYATSCPIFIGRTLGGTKEFPEKIATIKKPECPHFPLQQLQLPREHESINGENSAGQP